MGKTIYKNISSIFSIRIKTSKITLVDLSYNSINTKLWSNKWIYFGDLRKPSQKIR